MREKTWQTLLFLFGGGAQGITCADQSFTAAPNNHLASTQPPPLLHITASSLLFLVGRWCRGLLQPASNMSLNHIQGILQDNFPLDFNYLDRLCSPPPPPSSPSPLLLLCRYVPFRRTWCKSTGWVGGIAQTLLTPVCLVLGALVLGVGEMFCF